MHTNKHTQNVYTIAILIFPFRPNRCHGGFSCCPGWQLNLNTLTCTVPTCRNPCGFGICRQPNLCQCLIGGFGSNCPGSGSMYIFVKHRCHYQEVCTSLLKVVVIIRKYVHLC